MRILRAAGAANPAMACARRSTMESSGTAPPAADRHLVHHAEPQRAGIDAGVEGPPVGTGLESSFPRAVPAVSAPPRRYRKAAICRTLLDAHQPFGE